MTSMSGKLLFSMIYRTMNSGLQKMHSYHDTRSTDHDILKFKSDQGILIHDKYSPIIDAARNLSTHLAILGMPIPCSGVWYDLDVGCRLLSMRPFGDQAFLLIPNLKTT
jgi:hypothetical protein